MAKRVVRNIKTKVMNFVSWDCLYAFLLALMPFPWLNRYYFLLLVLVFVLAFLHKFLVQKEEISFVSLTLFFFAAIYVFVYISQKSYYLLSMIFWLASLGLLYNSRYKFIFWSYFISLAFSFFATTLLALAGFIPNKTHLGNNYLGFLNPNTTSMVAFNLITLYFFLRREKINFFEIAIIIGFVAFIYFEAGSETFLIVCCVELFLVGIFKLCKQSIYSCRHLPTFLEYSPYVFAVFSLILACLCRYDQKIFSGLYASLSSRLFWIEGNGVLNVFTFFGFGTMNFGPLDNAYAFALIIDGFVGFLLVTFYYSHTLHVMNKRHSYFVFMLIVFVLIYGITESVSARLPYTSALLFLLDKNQPCENDGQFVNSFLVFEKQKENFIDNGTEGKDSSCSNL